MVRIIKVISGGQTGVDQGCLAAARAAGIPTGGTAPKNYRTEDGNNPKLLKDRYHLEQHKSYDYPPRTYQNIMESDLTLIIGSQDGGTKLTQRIVLREKKNGLLIADSDLTDPHSIQEVADQIVSRSHAMKKKEIVINVAGNRESKSPGIRDRTKKFLAAVFDYVHHSYLE